MKSLLLVFLLTGCYDACTGEQMSRCRLMCDPAQPEKWSHYDGCICRVKP